MLKDAPVSNDFGSFSTTFIITILPQAIECYRDRNCNSTSPPPTPTGIDLLIVMVGCFSISVNAAIFPLAPQACKGTFAWLHSRAHTKYFYLFYCSYNFHSNHFFAHLRPVAKCTKIFRLTVYLRMIMV